MENLEFIKLTTYIFMIYLLLALAVERTIELLVAVYNYLELRFQWYQYWNRQARKLQERFDRLEGLQEQAGLNVRRLWEWLLWRIVAEPPYPGGRKIVSAELIRLNYFRIGTRAVAFFLALFMVLFQDLDFIKIVFDSYEKMLPAQTTVASILEYKPLRMVLAAIAISVGSEPLHQFIRQVEQFAQRRTNRAGGKQ